MNSVKFTSKINKAIKKIDKISKERLKKVGEYAENKVKENIDKPKTGRTYKVPGTNKTYTASAPGEAIASPKQVIRNSYKFRVEGEVAKVGSAHPFSLKFEKGEFRYIKPRPTLTPVLKEETDEFKKILGKRWF